MSSPVQHVEPTHPDLGIKPTVPDHELDPVKTTTTTRKKLFLGAIFSVYAPPEEKIAIEQFVMNEGGGAITASYDSAQYILIPKSINTHHAVSTLGPKLGRKAIRLEWIQDALSREEYVSRASYWAIPRSATAKPDKAEARSEAITRPSDPRLKGASQSEWSNGTSSAVSLPRSVATKLDPEGSWALTSYHTSGSLKSCIDDQRALDQAAWATAHRSQAAKSAPSNTSNTSHPRGSGPTVRPYWNLYAASCPRSPASPASALTTGLQIQTSQSVCETQSDTSFWVVGGPVAGSELAKKITARGGRMVDCLTRASRVIFAPPPLEFLQQTINDYRRSQQTNWHQRPCLAIAEGWIHECHAAGETRSWTPYRIIDDRMFMDKEYWRSVGGGFRWREIQPREEREERERFLSGFKISASSASRIQSLGSSLESQSSGPDKPADSSSPQNIVSTADGNKEKPANARKLTLIEEWRAARKLSLKISEPSETGSPKEEESTQAGGPGDISYPTPTSPVAQAGSKTKQWTALADAFVKSQKAVAEGDVGSKTSTTAGEPPKELPVPQQEKDDDYADLAGLFSSDDETMDIETEEDSEDDMSHDDGEEDNDDWEFVGSPGRLPSSVKVKQEGNDSCNSSPLLVSYFKDPLFRKSIEALG
ncbi:hypothetical protein I317_01643 [Kwoniella heveanensis CBS 569]|nr:hypothetical protein I317_01643 [Kwoniella heveanensis CBS 569]